MPKTVAQVSAVTDLLTERLGVTDGLVRDLWTRQDKSRNDVDEHRRELVGLRHEVAELRKQLDDERSRWRECDKSLVDLQRDVAALRQRSDDQTRQVEAWANRAWGLFVVLVGAVLSLASGLIVTLARK
jgi:chromosome segregation ATPase